MSCRNELKFFTNVGLKLVEHRSESQGAVGGAEW